ncbi:MAG: hypothetical protein QOH60_4411 [Mycobacterium sp.]|jgi:hypothetical protein|nr:hypothetical protein [Mycobacterium sp.]
MPRSFDLSADYSGSVEQVHSAFADKAYWQARLADSGVDSASLDSIAVDGDGSVAVVTTQRLRSDRLPGVVRQFHHGDLEIVRHEKWTPVTDGAARAEVGGEVRGAPVSLSGSAVLAPANAGSRLQITVSVDVDVPLVGGKLEDFIGTHLNDLIAAEQRFTTKWIAEHH